MLSVWYRDMKSLRTGWFVNVKEVSETSWYAGTQARRCTVDLVPKPARARERYINTLNTRVQLLSIVRQCAGCGSSLFAKTSTSRQLVTPSWYHLCAVAALSHAVGGCRP